MYFNKKVRKKNAIHKDYLGGSQVKKVQVLMSAYNGEKYISKQIDSILQQDYKDIHILIRDDGSSDKTVSILKEYSQKYHNISYYQGENKGVVGSFFDLMQHADKEMDYYSFSDQDDYWLQEKISHAIQYLEAKQTTSNVPILYCSNTIPVDANLKPIALAVPYKNFRPSFGNAVIQNINTGCTCVVNRKVIEMATKEVPVFTVMHDWWLYLIAACFGNAYFDENAYILYRQHGDNTIGARTSKLERWKYRIRNYKKNRGQICRQSKEFKRIFQPKGKNSEWIDLVIDSPHSMRKRIEMIKNPHIYRQRKSDDLIYKIMVLFGDT